MIINVTMRILSAIFYANLSQLFFSFMEENLADKRHRFCPSWNQYCQSTEKKYEN